METKTGRRRTRPVKCDRSGKDEMNLVEFPVALPGKHQPPATTRRVVFEKQLKGGLISRLTIFPSGFGFPMSQDDEVLVGLIRLSQEQGFEREVYFSRYQLMKVLGWNFNGQSYERIDLAVNRLCGVQYHWENSWWDKEAQSWVDENFGILDTSRMYDREKRMLRAGRAEQLPLPLSVVVWSDRLYRSFKAGYIKDLDMEIYRTLKHPVAKRLYRYLDKHFYRKRTVRQELQEFARTKLGYLGDYDNDRLRGLLTPAIQELEEVWPELRPASRQNRFVTVSRGRWELVFERAQEVVKTLDDEPAARSVPTGLEAVLTNCGISRPQAHEFAKSIGSEKLEQILEYFDAKRQQKQHRIGDETAYLVSLLQRHESFVLPTGFETRVQREAKVKAKTDRQRSKRREEASEASERALEAEEAKRRAEFVMERLADLSPLEIQSLEDRALAAAPEDQRRFFQNAKRLKLGAMFDESRNQILFNYLSNAAMDS